MTGIDTGRAGDTGRDAPRAGRAARLCAAAGALGTGLIIGGTGLAVFSRFFATRGHFGQQFEGNDLFGSYSHLDVSGTPDLLGATGFALGAALLLALVVVVVRARYRVSVYGEWAPMVIIAVAAGLSVLPIMAGRAHLPGIWRQVRTDYPLSQQLPTAVGAGVLIVVGTVLTLAVVVRPRLLRVWSWPALSVPLLAGVVVAAGTGVAAIETGDDARHIDQVTAAAEPVAAVPDRLGGERYRLSVPIPADSWSDRTDTVLAAGPGFVVFDAAGVTAYDGATGAPRWHYLRTHTHGPDRAPGVPLQSWSAQSLDDGSVVLARWEQLGWTAFDAMTGRILWRDTDYTRDIDSAPNGTDAGQLYESRSTPGYLMLSDGEHIARYDARTGARMWSVPTAQLGCTGAYQVPEVTRTAIYRAAVCSQGVRGEKTVVLTALDPGDGKVLARRELAMAQAAEESEARLVRSGDTVVLDWRMPESYAWLLVTVPDRLTSARVQMSPSRYPVEVDATGDEGLTYLPDRVSLAVPQCLVTDTTSGLPHYPVPGLYATACDDSTIHRAAFLTRELVAAQPGQTPQSRDYEVRSWDRGDGTPVTSADLHFDEKINSLTVLAVPGTLLVVGIGTHIEIVAYAR
ncbi:PQQ-binding-like beta-propeller repeat protein [Nocardia sp. NPDC020380]|uniref:outer membrane protein assembly factor BamB family protein n=1 Tax=Nocardia sp. NPDC020380 TaxID=3364309 RepID=UPI0037B9B6D3